MFSDSKQPRHDQEYGAVDGEVLISEVLVITDTQVLSSEVSLQNLEEEYLMNDMLKTCQKPSYSYFFISSFCFA